MQCNWIKSESDDFFGTFEVLVFECSKATCNAIESNVTLWRLFLPLFEFLFLCRLTQPRMQLCSLTEKRWWITSMIQVRLLSQLLMMLVCIEKNKTKTKQKQKQKQNQKKCQKVQNKSSNIWFVSEKENCKCNCINCNCNCSKAPIASMKFADMSAKVLTAR